MTQCWQNLLCMEKTGHEAIKKMKSALGEVVIEGVHTNIDYAYDIINNERLYFRKF